ncbi:hypothetical protein MSAN_00555800 [Mycena sanguinolenta]|uniref:Uncharacterized protein n=1 Tax=Mycena sanguinolenta TaxID=230812 RepID=A0A8H6ZBW4_9AGAR|nr:hypothetical protein MSAN_00555800 [Mycena sanguinolenta]
MPSPTPTTTPRMPQTTMGVHTTARDIFSWHASAPTFPAQSTAVKANAQHAALSSTVLSLSDNANIETTAVTLTTRVDKDASLYPRRLAVSAHFEFTPPPNAYHVLTPRHNAFSFIAASPFPPCIVSNNVTTSTTQQDNASNTRTPEPRQTFHEPGPVASSQCTSTYLDPNLASIAAHRPHARIVSSNPPCDHDNTHDAEDVSNTTTRVSLDIQSIKAFTSSSRPRIHNLSNVPTPRPVQQRSSTPASSTTAQTRQTTSSSPQHRPRAADRPQGHALQQLIDASASLIVIEQSNSDAFLQRAQGTSQISSTNRASLHTTSDKYMLVDSLQSSLRKLKWATSTLRVPARPRKARYISGTFRILSVSSHQSLPTPSRPRTKPRASINISSGIERRPFAAPRPKLLSMHLQSQNNFDCRMTPYSTPFHLSAGNVCPNHWPVLAPPRSEYDHVTSTLGAAQTRQRQSKPATHLPSSKAAVVYYSTLSIDNLVPAKPSFFLAAH